ncbi:hypothetical protein ACHAXS_004003 [Conticribra weissflogii]
MTTTTGCISAKSNGGHSAAAEATADTNGVDTKLLIRRTDSDFSSSRFHQTIHYLNSNTIVAVDNFGALDIVAIPFQSSMCQSQSNERGGGRDKFLADRLPLWEASCSNDIELFGYQGGNKIAVGTESGRMTLLSSLECHDSCVRDEQTENGNPADVHALWTCLPPTATTRGPLRRYLRNNSCSLSRMLAITDKEELLQTFNNYTTFEEIPHWDWDWNDDRDWNGPNSMVRRECSIPTTRRHRGGQWSFREAGMSGGGGGGSGTSLLGAFVDSERDCFSLRLVDERLSSSCQIATSSTHPPPAAVVVFVDDSGHQPPAYGNVVVEDVVSVCFSGEFGLVTAHNVLSAGNHPRGKRNRNVVKFWDYRMLWNDKPPVGSMNLTFPRDDVRAVTCHEELSIAGWVNHHHHDDDDDNDDAAFRIAKLTGSRDSSDRFVVSLTTGGKSSESSSRHILVDATRASIVRRIDTPPHDDDDHDRYGNHSCFSANLDAMAWFSGKELEIYDISRYSERRRPRRLRRTNIDGRTKRRWNMCIHDGGRSEKRATNDEWLLRKCSPNIRDAYGIDSTVSCMAMDDFGGSIACGTHDGDMFVIEPRRTCIL